MMTKWDVSKESKVGIILKKISTCNSQNKREKMSGYFNICKQKHLKFFHHLPFKKVSNGFG